MVELVKGISKLPDRRLEADRPRHSIQFINDQRSSTQEITPTIEHVWDQLKLQMPSCHSVHELELAVQDLWAHLLHNNIRRLINSMLDRVAICIEAGGGPMRYLSCPVFVSLHSLYSFNCLVFEIK
ncbi:transposable element Tcb2 transposase [Trichonephila clavipes]|nr:transposable element Tcb2 transposase [Trichonephila clavipes]